MCRISLSVEKHRPMKISPMSSNILYWFQTSYLPQARHSSSLVLPACQRFVLLETSRKTLQWVKKGRVKLQEPGFRCCCEYQWDAARFYFQGTTGTPGGGLAPRAFTLCSGHRTEKFSSFNTQPEETHTKRRSGSDLSVSGECFRLSVLCVTWLDGTSVVKAPGAALLETAHYCTYLLARGAQLRGKNQKTTSSVTGQHYCKCLFDI